MRLTFFCILLAACTGADSSDSKVTDTATSDTSDTSDSGTTDTTPPPECNTDNEDCSPGTCGGEGSKMLPGSDCLACHKPGGGEAPTWGVAGTIFTDVYGTDGLNNATITVTDANGKDVVLTSNSVGNFYTNEKVTPPLNAMVDVGGESRAMSSSVDTGACSSCHKCDGSAGGKLY
jgi:hypothetical protein